MALQNDIEARFIAAMKSKDAAALSALRLLRTALKNAAIEKQAKELTDEQTVEVVGREAKKLKDALSDYEQAGREDLAEGARAEIALLSGFLPAQLDEASVRETVKAKAAALGLSGEAAYGRLMGEAMKELKGKADGTLVGNIVKEVLQQG